MWAKSAECFFIYSHCRTGQEEETSWRAGLAAGAGEGAPPWAFPLRSQFPCQGREKDQGYVSTKWGIAACKGIEVVSMAKGGVWSFTGIQREKWGWRTVRGVSWETSVFGPCERSVCDEACLPALWHCMGGREDEVQNMSYLSSVCIFTVVLPITALNWMMSSQPCTKVSPTPAFSKWNTSLRVWV